MSSPLTSGGSCRSLLEVSYAISSHGRGLHRRVPATGAGGAERDGRESGGGSVSGGLGERRRQRDHPDGLAGRVRGQEWECPAEHRGPSHRSVVGILRRHHWGIDCGHSADGGPQLGAGMLVAIFVGGMAVGSLACDISGFPGYKAIKIDGTRLAGLALVVVGVLLVARPWGK